MGSSQNQNSDGATVLRIIKARDPMVWYAGLIGKTVPHCGEWPGEGYKSREPAGFVNIVYFDDAEIERGPKI